MPRENTWLKDEARHDYYRAQYYLELMKKEINPVYKKIYRDMVLHFGPEYLDS